MKTAVKRREMEGEQKPHSYGLLEDVSVGESESEPEFWLCREKEEKGRVSRLTRKKP